MNEFGPLWHPQTNLSTLDRDRLVITGGEGAWLTTEDGQRLLDLPASLWHANIGHGRTRVAEAAAAQMRTLETYHLFGGHAHRPAMQLAERLVAMLPMSEPSVFFTSGGSDSIDTACKLARRYWQQVGRPSKKLIISRTGGYHGLHGYGTSIAGLDFNREGYGTESLIPETARIPANDLAQATAIIEQIGAEHIAAIVAEPVIGTGGVIPPAEGYLEGLRALARACEIVFVADEVITGFGRLGRWFGSERWGLEPDMITMAKGLTSGYLPLGAVGIAGWLSDLRRAGCTDLPARPDLLRPRNGLRRRRSEPRHHRGGGSRSRRGRTRAGARRSGGPARRPAAGHGGPIDRTDGGDPAHARDRLGCGDPGLPVGWGADPSAG